MSRRPEAILPRALRDPRRLTQSSLAQWDELVRQARRADLLPRIAVLLDEMRLIEAVPAAPRAHLVAAQVLSAAQQRDTWRELEHVRSALASVGVDVVLLKGAAYLAAELPAAKGRVFGDIDILVPRSALPEVEAALMLRGWATTHHNAYDQRYYRRWMHELPPLRHVTRATVLDVHHGILPSTARLRPDSAKLLGGAIAVAGTPFGVLAPPDMVLHSATHLVYNEEFSHGLRDLVDLDALLRHFAWRDGFWVELCERAQELDLTRPLYYALRYAHRILHTPVPQQAFDAARVGAPAMLRGLMDALFERALDVDQPSTSGLLGSAARGMLYARGHWLRMPPHLLAWHLAVKAFRNEGEQPG